MNDHPWSCLSMCTKTSKYRILFRSWTLTKQGSASYAWNLQWQAEEKQLVKQNIKYRKFLKNAKNKTLGFPTYPLRRNRASQLIGKPILAHLYEFPSGILVRVREVRNEPYLGVTDFEVITVLKATTITIEEVHVMIKEVNIVLEVVSV